jgi:hypothetical protein
MDDDRAEAIRNMTRLQHQEKVERYRDSLRKQLGVVAPEVAQLEAMWTARPQRWKWIRRILFWGGVRVRAGGE